MKITSFGHATILIESGGVRVLVDPWLTQRLDRFWERNPPWPDGLEELLGYGIDYIVLTHHHCDHLHYPSLRWIVDYLGERGLLDELTVLYPESGFPMFTASGMGHLPVPLTLRHVGLDKFRGVKTGERVDLDGLRLTAFPSRVRFPEMSVLFQDDSSSVLFCADAVEHPRTWEYFTSPNSPALDLAFLPAHSTVPRNVLTERVLHTTYEDAYATSVTIFDRYVSTMNATLTVPFACGWKVSAEDGDFEWCNATMYPFTPVQARERLAALGRRGELMPPGTTVDLEGSLSEFDAVDGIKLCADVEKAYEDIRLDPTVSVPPFDPENDCCGTQREHSRELAGRLMDGFVGTDVWCQAMESGRRYVLRLADDAGQTDLFVLDPLTGVHQATQRDRDLDTTVPYVEIAGPTLQSLLDGDLLYGSSWGLWTSNVALLPAVFHHPRYNMAHLAKAMTRERTSSIQNEPTEPMMSDGEKCR
jgi:glyoxylase-like metal-dependent hydrolase (beta-lactamase superfamily II)